MPLDMLQATWMHLHVERRTFHTQLCVSGHPPCHPQMGALHPGRLHPGIMHKNVQQQQQQQQPGESK